MEKDKKDNPMKIKITVLCEEDRRLPLHGNESGLSPSPGIWGPILFWMVGSVLEV
jgi:hypothetical protein